MLALFLLIVKLRGEIPKEFRKLAEQAIDNSKIKIPLSERENTALPGDYSFQNYKFYLKYPLECPKSKQIKGYSIENNYLAVAKRKAFNLDQNFVFIDSTKQKIYRTSALVSSDDAVNIYQIQKLTMFDVFTHFELKSSTSQNVEQVFNLGYNPETNDVDIKTFNNELKFGAGITGTIDTEATIKFNTKYDFSFHAEIQLEAKVFTKLELNHPMFDIDLQYDDFLSFSKQLNEISDSFTFHSLIFDFNSYLFFNVSLNKIFLQYDHAADITKTFRITGSKYIDITPYRTIDGDWDLKIYNIPESITYPNYVESEFTKYLVICDIITNLGINNVLTIDGKPWEFSYGLISNLKIRFSDDNNYCALPAMVGCTSIDINAYYNIEEFNLYSTDGRILTIVPTSSNNKNIKNIDCDNQCTDLPPEVIDKLMQEANNSENTIFYKYDVGNDVVHIDISTYEISEYGYSFITFVPSAGYYAKGSYIFIKTGYFSIICKNITKVSDKVYAIYCTENGIDVLFRCNELRKTDIFFSDLKNSNDFMMNNYFEYRKFTEMNKWMSYIIPDLDNWQIITQDKTYLRQNEIYFGDDYKLINLYLTSGDSDMFFTNLMVYIPSTQLVTKFDIRPLKNLYSVFQMKVVSHPDLTSYSIRCNDQIEILKKNGNYAEAKFTFNITETSDNKLEFYLFRDSIDDYVHPSRLCEHFIHSQKSHMIYMLYTFPTKEGMNITSPGFQCAIIRNKDTAYYIQSEDSPSIYSGFSEVPNITLEVKDIKYDLKSPDPITHRLFCLRGNISSSYLPFSSSYLPFSSNYVTYNFTEVLESFGLSKYTTNFDFQIIKGYCLLFDIAQVISNNFNLNKKLVDFDLSDDQEIYIDSKVTYQPSGEENSPPQSQQTKKPTPSVIATPEQTKIPTRTKQITVEPEPYESIEIPNEDDDSKGSEKKNNTKMIMLICIIVASVVVVVIIILIIVFVVRKKNNRKESRKSRNKPLNPNGPQNENELSDDILG